MKQPLAFSLLLLVALSSAAGWAIGYATAMDRAYPGEIVCDNVEFKTFDVPYAVQAVCNDGVIVTLLD